MHIQVKDRDDQLAKAKRMMVALNNKFKAKFAKLEEKQAAKAAEGEGGASEQELEEVKGKLAASQRSVEELQEMCNELRSRLAGSNHAGEDSSADAEIAELREAVDERDAIIEKAKEKYQEMGRKARAAIDERDTEIASLNEQLDEVERLQESEKAWILLCVYTSACAPAFLRSIFSFILVHPLRRWLPRMPLVQHAHF